MRKIISGLIIALGIAIVGTGIYLQLDSKEEEIEVKEDTSFHRINTLKLEETCSTYEPITTYINTSNYTKISFNYPNCVHEYDLSFWHKNLQSLDENLSIDIDMEKDTLNNYMNEKKTRIIGYKNEEEYKNLNYTEINYFTTQDDLKGAMLEANYQYQFLKTNSSDLWYVAIQITEELLLTFEIESKDYILSYQAIEELVNNIIVEEDAAIFKNSKIDSDYQLGSIKINKKDEYEHGYKLNFKIATKYPEVDSYGSDYDESTFQYETVSEKFYANISLEKDFINDTIDEKVEKFKKIVLSSYTDSPEHYKNITDTGIIKKTINGKEIYYYIFKFDYYTTDATSKSYTGYYSDVFYQIAPNFYYRIVLSNKNIEINEAVISEFLNFDIEEY